MNTDGFLSRKPYNSTSVVDLTGHPEGVPGVSLGAGGGGVNVSVALGRRGVSLAVLVGAGVGVSEGTCVAVGV
jgi:hypothetical protein